MVLELEKSGLEKRQAELIVSALVTLTTANMDIVYKDMVTKSHQVGQQRLSESLLISRLLQMNRSCFLLARFQKVTVLKLLRFSFSHFKKMPSRVPELSLDL
ncbi:hypothetical protein ILYODFUR_035929 [Ilyodon furcidens]|uniref:Uncharacterized protein n=1 Tax=Ilyodon furcidens TaxID=33524 RepID=A0ABV0UB65_9TELE